MTIGLRIDDRSRANLGSLSFAPRFAHCSLPVDQPLISFTRPLSEKTANKNKSAPIAIHLASQIQKYLVCVYIYRRVYTTSIYGGERESIREGIFTRVCERRRRSGAGRVKNRLKILGKRDRVIHDVIRGGNVAAELGLARYGVAGIIHGYFPGNGAIPLPFQ